MADNSYVKYNRIKLLALDVDGILTDGGLYYTEDGQEIKKFNVKDGLGIVCLMKQGVEVAIISSNTSQATLHRAQKLGISHTFIGCEDKLPILKELCKKLKIALSEVAYMGDDLTDIPILDAVGFPLTVADAVAENKARAVYITKQRGGEGAVREVCDLILYNMHLS